MKEDLWTTRILWK